MASTSSDESSLGLSTAPTSPEWSPYLPPQSLNQTYNRRSRLDEVHASFSAIALGPAALSETPETGLGIQNVCVIGAGYVGGPTAAVLALHNPSVRVTVLDRDPSRIASWNSKHLPIHEPGLEQVVRLARDGGRRKLHPSDSVHNQSAKETRAANLFFSTDSAASIGSADMVLLAVNTPTKYSGRGAGAASDLSAVESAARDVAKFAKNGTIVVEKSTVPCGTARLIAEILSSTRAEETFPILSNPEFLAEGSAVKNLLHPDRVLIGCTSSVAGRLAARRLAALYASWIPRDRILHTNVWSSELAKLVANAMLAQRISSINSISALCERTGADVREITKAIGTDVRIGSKFLKSGLGFGGSCFRKDISSLVYIAESLHLPEIAEYWRAVLTVNGYQRVRFGEKLISRLNNTLNGKKIVLLGFSYKKDTGDTRESLAVDVIAQLLQERPAEIAIFDPCCPAEGISRELVHLEGFQDRVRIYSDPYAACLAASAVAVLTEWDFFKTERASPGLGTTTPAISTAPELGSEAETPLRDYLPPALAECSKDCKTCSSLDAKVSLKPGCRLDWAKVARTLKYPRYILDGRGILDERAMKTVGLQVDGLGWGSMSYGI